MSRTVLIVEDDRGLLPSLVTVFARGQFEVLTAASCAEALEIVRRRQLDLMLLDMKLPDGSGMDVLRAARDVDTELVVIVVTAFPDLKVAIAATKLGAYDFLAKPFDLDELRLIIARAVEHRDLQHKLARLERERVDIDPWELIGESAVMRRMQDEIRRAAGADVPVLIVGETGTGKELVATEIHRASARSRAPLIKTNCSTFSETLLESELFGHEKGAFTDARESRTGLLEMAKGGTLFLDEIAETKIGLQAKLLRALEGHPFRRVGGTREIRAEARIIAATNRDLRAEMTGGRFREDLYYRLNVFQIAVAPLRERRVDIPVLARHFLRLAATRLRKPVMNLAPEVDAALSAYVWPGNVRELRNVIERAVIICDGPAVLEGHLPGDLRSSQFIERSAARSAGGLATLEEMERRYIQYVVEAVSGNLSEAARMLGIARNTLKARLAGSEAVPNDDGESLR